MDIAARTTNISHARLEESASDAHAESASPIANSTNAA